MLTLKKLEQTIIITIDNDIVQAKSSYQQVAATRAAREYAAAALDAEQKKLENGKSTTYTVLQMQRDLTTARGNEIQALATYNKALAQLSLDEGTTLKRLEHQRRGEVTPVRPAMAGSPLAPARFQLMLLSPEPSLDPRRNRE